MLYEVTTGEGTVSLTSEQLLDTLIAKIKDSKKEDIENLASNLGSYLQANQIITDLKVLELLYTGMIIGYYYKVFLTNNQVKINHEATSN